MYCHHGEVSGPVVDVASFLTRCALTAAILVLATSSLLAATIAAASCAASDVQAAIDAAADNDVVLLPACNATWTTPSRNKAAITISGKAITLKGAGEDQTVITDATSGQFGEAPIWIIGVEGKTVRVTGLGFYGGPSSVYGLIFITGTSKNFRVDHCTFDHVIQRAIRIHGYTYGVIDHCRFAVTTNDTAQGVSVIGDGDAAWARPLTLGTSNAVYVEDCIFTYSFLADSAIDAYNGARYVFRHNQVSGTNAGHHGRDSGTYRSTHSFEIYDNTFDNPNTHIFTALGFRGGTGVVFNNVMTGAFDASIQVWNYRSCGSYPPAGICDGTSSYDGNTTGGQGYPCQDQIGRTTGQILSPLYQWNNTLKGNLASVLVDPNGCDREKTLHILANRDFYNNLAMPQYAPYPYPHPLATSDILAPKNLRITK